MAQVDRQFEATANRLRADAELIFAHNRNAARAVGRTGSEDPTVPILLPPAEPPPPQPPHQRQPRTDESEEAP
jgi:hypothetical protein